MTVTAFSPRKQKEGALVIGSPRSRNIKNTEDKMMASPRHGVARPAAAWPAVAQFAIYGEERLRFV